MFRRFRREKPPLRYFLYVADAELDMFFEQIDPALRRHISAEVSVDLKLAILTLRQTDGGRATVHARARPTAQPEPRLGHCSGCLQPHVGEDRSWI
ncbi:hypothetical protein AB5J72_36025 [Streptomyces sp. CG1]|uniref:DUF7019 family protein n=1 Tax=Streptomyces sp. CG1 TaxID=1287523 RepID=UPI0034E21036